MNNYNQSIRQPVMQMSGRPVKNDNIDASMVISVRHLMFL